MVLRDVDSCDYWLKVSGLSELVYILLAFVLMHVSLEKLSSGSGFEYWFWLADRFVCWAWLWAVIAAIRSVWCSI
jgi:hypothetical protein